MFCLKCGKQTGDDSEFCLEHKDDPVTEQSIKTIAEEDPLHAAGEYRRCPLCNEQVLTDLEQCPSCGKALRPAS
jgi:RNA polymerase subunit RPABC4/transcription elongation factor Spt4